MNAPEKVRQYDRAAQTVGNIVHLEHFNCCIDDQRLALLFYVVGLGATRDPYIFPGMENIWLNFGRTQVHMPSRAVPPSRSALGRSEEHTSELQSPCNLVCRLLLEKKNSTSQTLPTNYSSHARHTHHAAKLLRI